MKKRVRVYSSLMMKTEMFSNRLLSF